MDGTKFKRSIDKIECISVVVVVRTDLVVSSFIHFLMQQEGIQKGCVSKLFLVVGRASTDRLPFSGTQRCDASMTIEKYPLLCILSSFVIVD